MPKFSKAFHSFRLESKRGLWIVLCLSFVLKVGLKFRSLPDIDFWKSGYSFYYLIAENFLRTGTLYLHHGHGLYTAETLYAVRTPLYPLLIAAVCKLTDFSAAVFVLTEAFISTFTVFLVYLIAEESFNRRAAFLSAVFYGFYPYAVFHDTQLQENVLYNFLSLLAIWFLLNGIKQKKNAGFFLGGLSLGLATLTRASHVIHSFSLILIVLYLLRTNLKTALVATGLIILGLSVTLGPWVLRNKRVVGVAVVTTLTGDTLAEAHNPYTFLYYPYKGSIDLGSAAFKESLEKDGTLSSLPKGEMAQNKWYGKFALDYISNHKIQTLTRGIQKMAVNFLGVLSPLQDPLKNTSYFVSYWFLTLLALLGIKSMRQTAFFYFFITLCLSQAFFSFIFWAHSSHRTFLDPLLAVASGAGAAFLFSSIKSE